MKDTLYAQQYEAVGAFQFDDSVVAVFPDMIQRSVPGYQTILTGIGELTAQYARPNSHLYDLGCSLGAATLTMRRKAPFANCKVIGIDTSQPMIERAQEHLDGFHSDVAVELICGDMTTLPIENASVIVLNFTLQFIEPSLRQTLLTRLYEGLNPGGILILSEKVHFESPDLQNAIEHLHLQFKRANGYSELEIAQKRAALENVLQSDTAETHLQRFAKAGFQTAGCWFQAYNFMSFLAIKAPLSK
ncbi:carboxy-S-adenosyl-L-methionine synthase CmoA [Hydrogenovibrio sp. SC-1]|uniref:carboxy-S-adenosyl-L-methionine synthase CmoA n=1 Tax=Hydrogenovibrio sp. SC-1 TaxID=2065820 RepID=UPI000C7B98C0|nr:carboxy-S-adenosyl-L-methionine synthase CmoA [Hydrogenovibrio sp. SC-1]PLA75305.1 carboxy-S-adenosyl-L-methionine synthase CmoA [Hydrogenovibrio sp. SC-1]